MGKIRVKTFDENSAEDEAKLKAKREAKKAEKIAAKNELRQAQGKKTNPQTDGTIAKKGADIKPVVIQETVVETPEETVTTPETTVITPEETVKAPSENKKKQKKEKFAKASQKIDSKRHKENRSVISKTQKYKIDQAIEVLKNFKKSKFDETVELHINTREKGVNGQVTLPHGTGKTLKIKIADEAIIAEVVKGKINFDVLVATPAMMSQLAKVARVLGPRGLMPNPKNGTITENPEEAVKKLAGGQISYKTESQAPIIHTIVGKVSFEDNKLSENIKTFLTSVGTANIVSVTLKSTMSPGIKITI